MSSEFEFPADVSETWEVVPSNLELDDFHFIPAVAKSKIGSSTNLPKPAPLPVPPPQPKKGHYELPRSQPLSIPKFRFAGFPCGSVRFRVLGGWVGILP